MLAFTQVALLVSAWIEIALEYPCHVPRLVALLVSAWIEITYRENQCPGSIVALLVSAWIEIAASTSAIKAA